MLELSIPTAMAVTYIYMHIIICIKQNIILNSHKQLLNAQVGIRIFCEMKQQSEKATQEKDLGSNNVSFPDTSSIKTLGNYFLIEIKLHGLHRQVKILSGAVFCLIVNHFI